MRRLACCIVLGCLLGASSAEHGRRPAKLYEVRPRPAEPEMQLLRQTFPTYKTRSLFPSDDEYAKYIRATLTIGMRVRARIDYERVKKGMRGTYFGTNDGTPPCLVMWDDDLKSSSVLLDIFPRTRSSHAYWVAWHHVDLNLD